MNRRTARRQEGSMDVLLLEDLVLFMIKLSIPGT
jgi:hypothetical protein